MDDNLTDIELAERLKEGDQAAFTGIYNKYWELLLGIAYNRVKDTQVAEDIVQEVFTSLWRNRHKTEVISLKSYLATAVKYMALAYIEKQNRLPVTGQDTEELALPFFADHESEIHYKYLLTVLHQETNKLPEKCRIIFKYSRQDGLSVKEIASQMSISPRTVETQLSRALKHFRKSFRRYTTHFFTWL